MKKLSYFILSLFLLSSCSKQNDENAVPADTAHQKSVKVFKAKFYSTVDTDPSVPPTACSGDLPGLANPGYFLHGSATHMGELISQQSRGQDITCNLSFTTMLLTTSISGQLAASNGDLIYYTGVDAIDASQYLTGAGYGGTITGTWTINGGTGRFANATGSFDISGPVDFSTGTFSFDATGTISY